MGTRVQARTAWNLPETYLDSHYDRFWYVYGFELVCVCVCVRKQGESSEKVSKILHDSDTCENMLRRGSRSLRHRIIYTIPSRDFAGVADKRKRQHVYMAGACFVLPQSQVYHADIRLRSYAQVAISSEWHV